MNKIKIKNKTYKLPIFLPDATLGVTKSIDTKDLEDAQVKGAVVNTYHLNTNPSTKVLKKFKGIKNFMSFDGLIVSDSGGWQVFSLIHRNNKKGKITDEGVTFTIGNSSKKIFTPEDSIKIQFEIGSDIIICLDDFTPPNANKQKALETVERTTLWAKRCKEEYEKQLKKRKLTDSNRPHLYSVVQGGYFKSLRKKSSKELIDIGFDGYGYGGYVVNKKGKLDLEISEYIANLLPDDKVKFALGMGRIDDIVHLRNFGWDIFDCTLPTRDARHKRLYIYDKKINKTNLKKPESLYSYLYINKSKYSNDLKPISSYCDCLTCKNYSRAYLRHLFKIDDSTAYRLATIHNLRTYTLLLEHLE